MLERRFSNSEGLVVYSLDADFTHRAFELTLVKLLGQVRCIFDDLEPHSPVVVFRQLDQRWNHFFADLVSIQGLVELTYVLHQLHAHIG